MKVLQVSKFYPPHLGGIETVAQDLSHGLVARGVEVEVLCANQGREQLQGRDADGTLVTRAGSFGMLLSTSMAPALLPLLRQRRDLHDIVHVHMPDPAAALAVWYARPTGKLVLHWHSDVVRQRWARHVYHPLQQWLLRRADLVICTSTDYACSSEPLAPWLDKVRVVPIGRPAPPAGADPQLLRRLRQRHAGRRIVFALGRMTYYKGYDVLLRAATALPQDVVVLVAGGGPDRPRYQALAAEQGVADRVHFVGPLSPAWLEAYFAAADLFCMASTVRAEAYGVAVLEAMARGLPVVATHIPGSGLTWLHQHGITGLAVPPADPQALAAALRQMLDDPELRARCGQGARARWAAGLTAQHMCDQTLGLYRHLLGGTIQHTSPLSDSLPLSL